MKNTYPCPKCGNEAKSMVALAMKHLMCIECWKALSRCERIIVTERAYRDTPKKIGWSSIAAKVWAGWGET